MTTLRQIRYVANRVSFATYLHFSPFAYVTSRLRKRTVIRIICVIRFENADFCYMLHPRNTNR